MGVYLVLLGWYHWDQLSIPLWRIPVIVSFVWMVLICVAAHLNRPTRSETPDLKVAVIIPSHNEDPDMLRIMLNSVESQTTPPFAVYSLKTAKRMAC